MAWEQGGLSRLRSRGGAVAVVVALAVIALLVGGQLDRAPTEGRYRPDLRPPALEGACDPLPAGVDLDLHYQVRADRALTVGDASVRRLDLHYDLLDEATAQRRVVTALEGAGFTETDPPADADPAIEQWFTLPDYGVVGVAVRAFDVEDDSIVRGALTLDVPSATLTPEVEATCDDPQQTKRYPEYSPGGPIDMTPGELFADRRSGQ